MSKEFEQCKRLISRFEGEIDAYNGEFRLGNLNVSASTLKRQQSVYGDTKVTGNEAIATYEGIVVPNVSPSEVEELIAIINAKLQDKSKEDRTMHKFMSLDSLE